MEKNFIIIAKKAVPILKKNGVRKAGIFGSYVHGKQRKTSDIDILVELKKGKSLLDFVGIKLEIEEALGKKVDLVEYNAIKPILREKILNEQVIIL